jgi:hypothetical protein
LPDASAIAAAPGALAELAGQAAGTLGGLAAAADDNRHRAIARYLAANSRSAMETVYFSGPDILLESPSSGLANHGRLRKQRNAGLEVRVNDLLCTDIPTLYGRGPRDRVYTLRRDDGGGTTIAFGDGVEGARLSTGQNNVRLTYRKGIGTGGNLRAGRLTNLLTRPLGVQGVTNPDLANGGQDPPHGRWPTGCGCRNEHR